MNKPEFVGYLVVPKNRVGILEAASGDWDARNLYTDPTCATEFRNKLNEDNPQAKWEVRRVVVRFDAVIEGVILEYTRSYLSDL